MNLEPKPAFVRLGIAGLAALALYATDGVSHVSEAVQSVGEKAQDATQSFLGSDADTPLPDTSNSKMTTP